MTNRDYFAGDDGDRHSALMSVGCDGPGCDTELRADFRVDTRAQGFAAIYAYARERGWSVDEGRNLTFCPAHREDPAEPVGTADPHTSDNRPGQAASAGGMTDQEKTELSAQLSPTMELVLDTLAARHRLGETLWTFGAQAQLAIDRLESLGLATQMHGVVERTVRASLTDRGRDLMLLPGYVTPSDRRIAELEDLLGTVSLHIGWRFVTKQLTTDQKELFAGVREQWSDRLRAEEGIDPPPTAEERAESDLHYRWWRR